MNKHALAALSFLSAFALVAAAGCGDQVIVQGQGGAGGGSTSSSTGTGAGSSTSSSGTGGSGGVVPPECQVQTNLSPPYAVAFDFINNGPMPLYLAQDCYLHYSVSSCADGYSQPLSIRADCTVDCAAEPNECIACGACPFGAVGLASGQAVDDPWKGFTFTFGENKVGCSCHNRFEAAAGLYRITVPVYGSEDDVQLAQPMWTVEQDFQLPAPSGVVSVWLHPDYDSP